MNKTLKIISLLLSYPTAELQLGGEELKKALAGEKLSPGIRRLLDSLVDYVCDCDLYEAQERYVHLFDRTRSLSLHLFEHVHGESRDRGQAMVDLMKMYDENCRRCQGTAGLSAVVPRIPVDTLARGNPRSSHSDRPYYSGHR